MTNDSIDAKGTRAKALGTRGSQGTSLGRKGARPLMSMHARGFGNCSYKYSKHLFDHKMTNDSIDAKGTRAKAFGTQGREGASLGCKGARPLMSMHAGGWEL